MDRSRLLYLGFALPPGLQQLYPGLNPAGHAFESEMVGHLSATFSIRSVGVLPFPVSAAQTAGVSIGVPHSLLLLDRAPEIIYRALALWRLKRQFRQWQGDWRPELLLVYNFSPIYNAFLRSLDSQSICRILLLADSDNLGRNRSAFKQLRHRFKPMAWSDEAMIPYVDGCVALSEATQPFFARRNVPWLWMPGGCRPARALSPVPAPQKLAFGYFGSLAPHSGIDELLRAFSCARIQAPLHVWGYGKGRGAIAERCRADPRVVFHDLVSTPDDLLKAASQCTVLINPRPATYGNTNNFPSKVFEYSLCGRAILTTRMSGVERVLGPDAFYIGPGELDTALPKALEQIASLSQVELQARAERVQQRVLRDFNWTAQASRLVSFMEQCRRVRQGPGTQGDAARGTVANPG